MSNRDSFFREVLSTRLEYRKSFSEYIMSIKTKGQSKEDSFYTELLLIDVLVTLGKLNDARRDYYSCIKRFDVDDINLESELLNFRLRNAKSSIKIRHKSDADDDTDKS